MTIQTTTRPNWADYWATVGSEEWLAAKALIELSDDLHREAVTWLRYVERPQWDDSGDEVESTYTDVEFDWPGWLASVDTNGRGWCSSAARLFEVVSALLDPERTVHMSHVLGYMGSWDAEVWRILVDWGTGGNNRDRPGRLRVSGGA